MEIEFPLQETFLTANTLNAAGEVLFFGFCEASEYLSQQHGDVQHMETSLEHFLDDVMAPLLSQGR